MAAQDSDNTTASLQTGSKVDTDGNTTTTAAATASAGPKVNITVEFGGGMEVLFSYKRSHPVSMPAGSTIRELIAYLLEEMLSDKSRPDLFAQGDTVRPGILVLVNDTDWELEGELEYKLQEKDSIMFISTLHGGSTIPILRDNCWLPYKSAIMYLSSFDTLTHLPSTLDGTSPLSSAASSPGSGSSSFGFSSVPSRAFRSPSDSLPMFASRSARTGHLDAPMDLSLPPLGPLPAPPRKRRPETLTTTSSQAGGLGLPGIGSGSGRGLPSLSSGSALPPLSAGYSSFATGGTGSDYYPNGSGRSYQPRQRRGSNASLTSSRSGSSSSSASASFGSPSYTASPFDSLSYGALPPLSSSTSPFSSGFGGAGAGFGAPRSGYAGRSRKMSSSSSASGTAYGYGLSSTAGPGFGESSYYSTGKRTYPVF